MNAEEEASGLRRSSNRGAACTPQQRELKQSGELPRSDGGTRRLLLVTLVDSIKTNIGNLKNNNENMNSGYSETNIDL